MIIDSALFLDEIDLAIARVNILKGLVDKHVFAVSPWTFPGRRAPSWEPAKEALKEYPVEWIELDRPVLERPLDEDIRRRHEILDELKPVMSPDDIIFYSDLDEIPSAQAFQQAVQVLQSGEQVVVTSGKHYPVAACFRPRWFYYWMNAWQPDERGICGRMATFGRALEEGWWGIRNKTAPSGDKIITGGWHWGWLGGVKGVIEKLSTTPHTELDTPELRDPAYVESCIESGWTLHSRKKLIFLDMGCLPEYVRNNLSIYGKYIYGHR